MTKVFISSTSQDLKPYREAAVEICIRFGCTPIAMEYFPAMPRGATEGCKQKVADSDLYVGIFAHRYGYIEEGYDQSVTEIEFDHAGECKLDRLCFLVDPDYDWPDEYKAPENAEKLQAFKNKIDKTLIRAQFTTVDDFRVKLTQALVEWLGIPRYESSDALFTHDPTIIPGYTDKFRGRTDLIQQIQTALSSGEKVLLHGFGGMGKTALAVECAAAHLPVLWVQASSSVDAMFEAMARQFSAHQEIARQTGAAKTALMKQILAGSGAKLLLIDDVWDGSALYEFMRAVPKTLKVLVTSRQSYQDYQRIKVAELEANEALDVLSTYARRDLRNNPDAAALCNFVGYHALALRIAGGMMSAEDNLSAKQLYEKIKPAPHERLEVAEGDIDRGHETIKKLIDVSLNALAQKALAHEKNGEPRKAEEYRQAGRIFLAFGAMFVASATAEMMSLYFTGVDPELLNQKIAEYKKYFPEDAAKYGDAVLRARMWKRLPKNEMPLKKADLALTILAQRGLAEKIPATAESIVYYRIHDLAYSYAKAQTTDEQRHRALEACLNYTWRYNEPNLQNFAALRPELDNFLGAAAFAMQTERWSEAERFARNLYTGEGAKGGFLLLRGFYTQAITLLAQATYAAEKQGNKQNQGAHLGNLGNAYAVLGEYEKAIDYHEQALQISRSIGDKRGEGSDLGNLGIAYRNLGEYLKAIEYHEQALHISRDIGDKQGEGNHLGNLGNAYRNLGEYLKAIEYHEQALHISRDIGDKQGEGNHLGNLGIAYRNLGEYLKAMDYHKQALQISREIGDRMGEATDLNNIGVLLKELGNYDLAIQFYQQARTLRVEMGLTHMVEKTDARIAEAKRLKEQASSTQGS